MIAALSVAVGSCTYTDELPTLVTIAPLTVATLPTPTVPPRISGMVATVGVPVFPPPLSPLPSPAS